MIAVESRCFDAEGGTGNLDETDPSGRRRERKLIKTMYEVTWLDGYSW